MFLKGYVPLLNDTDSQWAVLKVFSRGAGEASQLFFPIIFFYHFIFKNATMASQKWVRNNSDKWEDNFQNIGLDPKDTLVRRVEYTNLLCDNLTVSLPGLMVILLTHIGIIKNRPAPEKTEWGVNAVDLLRRLWDFATADEDCLDFQMNDQSFTVCDGNLNISLVMESLGMSDRKCTLFHRSYHRIRPQWAPSLSENSDSSIVDVLFAMAYLDLHMKQSQMNSLHQDELYHSVFWHLLQFSISTIEAGLNSKITTTDPPPNARLVFTWLEHGIERHARCDRQARAISTQNLMQSNSALSKWSIELENTMYMAKTSEAPALFR